MFTASRRTAAAAHAHVAAVVVDVYSDKKQADDGTTANDADLRHLHTDVT